MSTLKYLKDVKTLSNVQPNEISKVYHMEMLRQFTEAKMTNPNLKQKELCTLIGSSPSKIKRVRKELNVPSPYRIAPSHAKQKPKTTKCKVCGEVYVSEQGMLTHCRARSKICNEHKEYLTSLSAKLLSQSDSTGEQLFTNKK